MADHTATGPSFKDLEQQGWHAKAVDYDASAGKITVGAAAPLLDAAGVRSGMSLLDIACGPGYVAADAAARGARVVGIDFAAAMVEMATRLFPAIEFRAGDAENLAFPANSFDAVVCGFGLLHLADPDKAVAEACRVLKPGGRYAFSVWAGPDRHEFMRMVTKAVHDHADTKVALPPAPPIFRFADAAECRRVLAAAGFVDVAISEVPLVMHADSIEGILDFIYKGTVRTAMMLEYQTAEVRERVHDAIRKTAESFARPGGYDIGWMAVVVAATKPA